MEKLTCRVIPFLWGFSEATFFFIVPDVWLTVLACRASARRLWIAIGWTLLGALLGGASMYVAGMQSPLNAAVSLILIPGIDSDLMMKVVSQTKDHGLWAMGLGMLTGWPYKIYAAAWGALHGDFLSFCAATVLFRGMRFVAVGFLAKAIFTIADKVGAGEKLKARALAVVWIAFYIMYFHHFGWVQTPC